MNENTRRYLKNAGYFVCVAAVSVLALWIMSLIADRAGESTAHDALQDRYGSVLSAERYSEIDISEAGEPYSNITAAYSCEDNGKIKGYIVELLTEGYGGDMELIVGVSADGKRVTGIRVGDNSETEGVGSKVTESTFLSQFAGAQAPFEVGTQALEDGTYFAKAESYDSGYRDNVTLTVENGMITKALWDAESESGGKSKRQASIDGEYVMTADGLMWHEQAQLLESRLLEVQSPAKIVHGSDGKTDAIAGVSIRITPFLTLAAECFAQAGGPSGHTAIDAAAGATISSRAVVSGANAAAGFTHSFILGNSETVPGDISGSDAYE